MIKLVGICKSYQLGETQLKALDKVSLTIEQGEYISVMGPSGSGKSTLLNMVGLLDVADSGELILQGSNTCELTEEQRAKTRRDRIGFIFQSFHLIPRLTAAENVEVPLMLAGMPVKDRQQKVMALLDELGMAQRAHHLPKQLSGGQLQRVAIARAIVMEPDILLADEPTGNLDSNSGDDVINVLERLNAKNITLLIVTHDISIGQRAKRRIRMVDGCIVADES